VTVVGVGGGGLGLEAVLGVEVGETARDPAVVVLPFQGFLGGANGGALLRRNELVLERGFLARDLGLDLAPRLLLPPLSVELAARRR